MTFSIDLDGRRALVTGAGQGVGRAVAQALADAGATVVVNDVRPEVASLAVDEIVAGGGRAEALPFDVTDFEAVQAAISSLDGLDILVNNAGTGWSAGADVWTFKPFEESTPAEWARYFDVNLYGVMNCTHAALPLMIEGGYGRVITMISDASRWGEPYLAAYAAAKAGAAGFARSIAREGGRHGITVNNISLGTIAPHQDEQQEQTEAERRQLASYIIRRFGQADDVAPLVTLLASPLASWITGQTIPVNGGYTVNL